MMWNLPTLLESCEDVDNIASTSLSLLGLPVTNVIVDMAMRKMVRCKLQIDDTHFFNIFLFFSMSSIRIV